MVKGADIADLEIVHSSSIVPPPSQPEAPPATVALPAPSIARPPSIASVPRSGSANALRFVPASVSRPPPSTQPSTQPLAAPVAKFVDPAILSYDRVQAVLLPPKPPYPTAVENSFAMPNSPGPAQNHTLAVRTTVPVHQHPAPSSDKIYDYVVVDNDTKQEEVEEVTVIKAESRRASKTDQSPQPVVVMENENVDKKKSRMKPRVKPKRRKREEAEAALANNLSSPELARAEPGVSGWRETPIIDTASFVKDPDTEVKASMQHLAVPPRSAVAKGKLKKMSRREREKFEAQTGWATEDGATDVQDLSTLR